MPSGGLAHESQESVLNVCYAIAPTEEGAEDNATGYKPGDLGMGMKSKQQVSSSILSPPPHPAIGVLTVIRDWVRMTIGTSMYDVVASIAWILSALEHVRGE